MQARVRARAHVRTEPRRGESRQAGRGRGLRTICEGFDSQEGGQEVASWFQLLALGSDSPVFYKNAYFLRKRGLRA